MKPIRTFSLIGILSLCLFSCRPQQDTTRQQIHDMVEQIHLTYPAATLQDVYKTCYQDYWGAEHIAPDSLVAAGYLEYELETMQGDTMHMPKVEPCGWRHRYERLSLQMITDGEVSKEELLSRFLHAASETPEADGEWEEEWRLIDSIAIAVVPEWQDSTLRADLMEAAQLNAAIHHSSAFRETYHPHYRIAKRY